MQQTYIIDTPKTEPLVEETCISHSNSSAIVMDESAEELAEERMGSYITGSPEKIEKGRTHEAMSFEDGKATMVKKVTPPSLERGYDLPVGLRRSPHHGHEAKALESFCLDGALFMDPHPVKAGIQTTQTAEPPEFQHLQYDELSPGFIRLLSLHGSDRETGMLSVTFTQAKLEPKLFLRKMYRVTEKKERWLCEDGPADFLKIRYRRSAYNSWITTVTAELPNLVVPVEAVPQYTEYCALSYRWGNAQSDDPWILVNRQKLQIRRNLFQFLCRASKFVKCPLLWIDAICINQFSKTERNHQVGLMDVIYKSSTRVIIWLGNIDHPGKTLLADLRKGFKWAEAHCDTQKIDLLVKVLSLEYWSRMWVVQEIRHAPKGGLLLMCGSQLIEWDDFWVVGLDLLARMDPLRYHSALVWHTDTHRDGRKLLMRSDNLFDLLLTHANFRCDNIRDRVVALLSLVAEDIKLDRPYDGTDAGFVLRCTMAFRGNLEGMARLAKTLNVTSDQLVAEARLNSPNEFGNLASDEAGEIFAVFPVDRMVYSLRRKLIQCSGCFSKLSETMQSVFVHCDVFCLGAMSCWRHLFFLHNTPHTTDTEQVIFLDCDEQRWPDEEDLAYVCDDSDVEDHGSLFGKGPSSIDRRGGTLATQSIDRSAIGSAARKTFMSLSAPLMKGRLSFTETSFNTYEMKMSLDLFAYLTRYAPAHFQIGDVLPDMRERYTTSEQPSVRFERAPAAESFEVSFVKLHGLREEARVIELIDGSWRQES